VARRCKAHVLSKRHAWRLWKLAWVPACAGMTLRGGKADAHFLLRGGSAAALMQPGAVDSAECEILESPWIAFAVGNSR
jgi:hypothetical protein